MGVRINSFFSFLIRFCFIILCFNYVFVCCIFAQSQDFTEEVQPVDLGVEPNLNFDPEIQPNSIIEEQNQIDEGIIVEDSQNQLIENINEIDEAKKIQEKLIQLMPEQELESDQVVEVEEVDLAVYTDDLNYYDPRKGRDPFLPYVKRKALDVGGLESDLQNFDLAQLKLVGILWNVKEPKALISDPSGRVYTVKKMTRLGRNNGYIAVIREGEIVLVESFEEDGKREHNVRTLTIDREDSTFGI